MKLYLAVASDLLKKGLDLNKPHRELDKNGLILGNKKQEEPLVLESILISPSNIIPEVIPEVLSTIEPPVESKQQEEEVTPIVLLEDKESKKQEVQELALEEIQVVVPVPVKKTGRPKKQLPVEVTDSIELK